MGGTLSNSAPMVPLAVLAGSYGYYVVPLAMTHSPSTDLHAGTYMITSSDFTGALHVHSDDQWLLVVSVLCS